jgi:hypothetical protein
VSRDALSILRRQANRGRQYSLPWSQLLSLSAVPLLRIPLQHARETGAMEPRESEVAGTAPISEGMEEKPDGSATC